MARNRVVRILGNMAQLSFVAGVENAGRMRAIA